MKDKARLTLDASVLAKWFIEETGSDRAVEIRDSYLRGDAELSTSSLALFELGNVFWKHPRKTPEDVKEDFAALLALGIKTHSFNDLPLITEAFKNAREMSVTFCDASYIAVSQAEDATLVTADGGLHAKIRKASRAVLLSEYPVKGHELRMRRVNKEKLE